MDPTWVVGSCFYLLANLRSSWDKRSSPVRSLLSQITCYSVIYVHQSGMIILSGLERSGDVLFRVGRSSLDERNISFRHDIEVLTMFARKQK